MDATKEYEAALVVVHSAIQADKEREYEKAFSLYTKAIEQFLSGMKSELRELVGQCQ